MYLKQNGIVLTLSSLMYNNTNIESEILLDAYTINLHDILNVSEIQSLYECLSKYYGFENIDFEQFNKTIAKNFNTGFWYTKEIVNLLQWIRNYNLNKAKENQIRFYGMDIQLGKNISQEIREFVNINKINRINDERNRMLYLMTK